MCLHFTDDGTRLVEQSAMLFTIVKVEEAITKEKHHVKYDRTRLALQETEGGMLTRCWVYGQHSRAVGKLGVKVGDMVLVSAVKKSIFAPKPGEEILANFSPWILHCGDNFGLKPSVAFIRKEVDQGGVAGDANQEEDQPQQQFEAVATPAVAAPLVKCVRSISPAKNPTMAQDAPRSQYCRLADLKDTSARYNLFAVVSEVVEQPRGRKSKIVARVRLSN